MKKNFWAFFFVFFFTGIFSTSTQASLPQIKKTTLYKIFEPVFSIIGYREIKVQVYDQDTLLPIENAVVMIGETDNTPFEKNWTTTDKNGVASFDGFTLPQGPLAITAGHEAYSRYTIFQTQANELRIPISKLKDDHPKTTLTGSLTHWPDMEDQDGIVQIGLMIPAADILTLLNFSSEKLMAPFVKAKIYKETKVPGNLVIPSQEELFWGFVPVTLSKPTYQIPLISDTQKNLIALTGEVPFGPFASGVINKQPFSKLLNLISMNQLGLVRDWKVPASPSTTLDVPLNYTLKSKFSISVTQSPENMDILYFSAAAFKEKLAALFPLDFKMSARADKAKSANLKSLPASNLFPPFQEMVVAIAADLPQTSSETRKRDTAITGVVKRPETDTSVYLNTFLNFMEVNSASNHFSYKERATSHSIPSQMSVSYISVRLPSTEEQKGYTRVWWTVVAPSSLTDFMLPTLPGNLSQSPVLQSKEKLEWSLNVLGLNEKNYTFDYNNLDDTTLSLGLSHFSQNSLTLAKALE
ncbi:MAG: hypothetical protein HYY61_00260 [Deltaproteobacteria bacterium]|nr:hypothetical protein [Deltaproteobacteria bacterium]